MADILFYGACILAAIALQCWGHYSHAKLWKYIEEEKERRKRVKALYPEPLSYEERMGVRYGQKREESDE